MFPEGKVSYDCFRQPSGLGVHYDILVSILFGWFLMRYVQIDIGPDPESLVVASLVFMLVTAVKTTIYSLQWFAETE